MYSHIAKTVFEFNFILKDLCLFNNWVLVGCFREFLSLDLGFCSKELQHDWPHLNNRGGGVVSNWLKGPLSKYFDLNDWLFFHMIVF